MILEIDSIENPISYQHQIMVLSSAIGQDTIEQIINGTWSPAPVIGSK